MTNTERQVRRTLRSAGFALGVFRTAARDGRIAVLYCGLTQTKVGTNRALTAFRKVLRAANFKVHRNFSGLPGFVVSLVTKGS